MLLQRILTVQDGYKSDVAVQIAADLFEAKAEKRSLLVSVSIF